MKFPNFAVPAEKELSDAVNLLIAPEYADTEVRARVVILLGTGANLADRHSIDLLDHVLIEAYKKTSHCDKCDSARIRGILKFNDGKTSEGFGKFKRRY